jgi:uracil-DNA glycosylase
VLVGEAPSRRSDPEAPFSGSSGARLAALLGRPLDEVFDLRNLLDSWPGPAGKASAFDSRAARASAYEIRRQALLARKRPRLVLVGRRVARAFDVRGDYLVWQRHHGLRVAILPHPSGIVRWWNDPANVERARRFIRSLD